VLLLLVLDDADLHEHQTPFSLGASRAIASTLNSLVFHTAFPESKGKQQPGQQQQAGAQHQLGATAAILPATFRHGLVSVLLAALPLHARTAVLTAVLTAMLTAAATVQGLLQAHAPTALRGLYERDARKSFCQPSLWTEPYSNMMARLQAAQPQQQEGGVLGLTAAVVQALLVSTGLTGQDEEGGGSGAAAAAAQQPVVTAVSSSQPGPLRHDRAAAAAQGVSITGLRTGALLSLLRAAPQCVPFPVRLELFRQMLEQDKVWLERRLVACCWLLMPAVASRTGGGLQAHLVGQSRLPMMTRAVPCCSTHSHTHRLCWRLRCAAAGCCRLPRAGRVR
jgi:ubiquitin-protein ligase E3 C